MIDGLFFDEATHTYYYNGNKVPGVTSILEDVGLSDFSMVPPDILAQAQALGTEVHHITELSDKGEDIGIQASEAGMAMLLQYDQFIYDFQVTFIEVEKKIFCEKYLYAGTLDRIAVFNKLSDKPVLFDIKTGQPSISHQIQTAAYEYAYKEDKRSKMDRYTLYLSTEGYKLSEPYRNRQDFDVFLSALSVYNYKRR